MAIPVIAIFDIGKTNKKLFLLDRSYSIVFGKSESLTETIDPDGDPCENLESLQQFVHSGLQHVLSLSDFSVKAVNCSAYGASLVYIDDAGQVIAPLYNYLKPYPSSLQKKFFETHGGEHVLSFQTASPVLGSLNSGLQLYRIKHEQPALYERIRYALHLPQYIAYLLSGQAFSEMTSIGCHTFLWDYRSNDYHA